MDDFEEFLDGGGGVVGFVDEGDRGLGGFLVEAFVDDSGTLEILERSGDDRDADSGGDKADDGLHLNGFLDDRGTEARLLAKADDLVVESGCEGARENDEGF